MWRTRVEFRLPADEKQAIHATAQDIGISVSAYLRILAIRVEKPKSAPRFVRGVTQEPAAYAAPPNAPQHASTGPQARSLPYNDPVKLGAKGAV
jgi:hypothetical protein